eukprot:5614751-Amphidinium_carterae.1
MNVRLHKKSKGTLDYKRNAKGAPQEYYRNGEGILEHKRNTKGILEVNYRVPRNTQVLKDYQDYTRKAKGNATCYY